MELEGGCSGSKVQWLGHKEVKDDQVYLEDVVMNKVHVSL